MIWYWLGLYWRELLLMLLALVGSHCAAYLLGEQNGQKFYWWRLPEEPKARQPKQLPPEDVPFLEPDAVTIETVIVPLPADFEDTVTALEARALAAEAEAAHQEQLKQRHIKDKKKLKEQL